ncbi:hypothetical protein BDP81DRAFT_438576 [Colletotrichum phormii]|uniref:Uncharacterized protein n=1 Tax=Colletotrichum phormii TaxID=359342 RepID=A0AAI9ZGK0_9PEZI|nr:uncharacterized protein BDP81DRAFT_438576 [Colletotrichum phormii]KAK1624056.1 hypothetical protein BDP81DRAFT_438576 [Colletotrichum phormii]
MSLVVILPEVSFQCWTIALTTFANGPRAKIETRDDSVNASMIFESLSKPTFNGLQRDSRNAMRISSI